MTREEAIVLIERAANELREMMKTITMPTSAAEQLQQEIDAHEIAISALRQQERERNEPLTMDELREMDKEPVWWWNKSAKPVCTICVWDRFMNEPMFANYDWQSEYTLQLSKV